MGNRIDYQGEWWPDCLKYLREQLVWYDGAGPWGAYTSFGPWKLDTYFNIDYSNLNRYFTHYDEYISFDLIEKAFNEVRRHHGDVYDSKADKYKIEHYGENFYTYTELKKGLSIIDDIISILDKGDFEEIGKQYKSCTEYGKHLILGGKNPAIEEMQEIGRFLKCFIKKMHYAMGATPSCHYMIIKGP